MIWVIALKNQRRSTIKGTLQLLCQELPCKQSSCRVPSEYPQRYTPTCSSHSLTHVAGQEVSECVVKVNITSEIWINKNKKSRKRRNQMSNGIPDFPSSGSGTEKRLCFNFQSLTPWQTIPLFSFYCVRLNVIVKVNQSHILHTGKCNYVNESGSEVKFKVFGIKLRH